MNRVFRRPTKGIILICAHSANNIYRHIIRIDIEIIDI